MQVDPRELGKIAGHVTGALELVRILLVRHDLGPIARDVLARAEESIILARDVVAPLVAKANPPTPVAEQFGTFE